MGVGLNWGAESCIAVYRDFLDHSPATPDTSFPKGTGGRSRRTAESAGSNVPRIQVPQLRFSLRGFWIRGSGFNIWLSAREPFVFTSHAAEKAQSIRAGRSPKAQDPEGWSC